MVVRVRFELTLSCS